jgi:hypothetical protein
MRRSTEKQSSFKNHHKVPNRNYLLPRPYVVERIVTSALRFSTYILDMCRCLLSYITKLNEFTTPADKISAPFTGSLKDNTFKEEASIQYP